MLKYNFLNEAIQHCDILLTILGKLVSFYENDSLPTVLMRHLACEFLCRASPDN